MVDPRVERVADVIVAHSLRVRAGERVVLSGPSLAAPLIAEIYRRAVRVGAHVRIQAGIDGVAEARLAEASDAQLDWVDPRSVTDTEEADAKVAILAEVNTRSLSAVDPSRQARVSRARAPLVRRQMERFAAGEYRWLVTAFPTTAAAQEARMSLAEYERFVFAAQLLDGGDSVRAWRELGRRIGGLAEWLATVSELRVVAEGTDLTFSVEGRSWSACGGEANLPDGECFTAPVESSVEGEIHFTYPAVFHHRAVEDVRLRFRGGEVVDATAARGQEFLEEMLALDEGARRVGEFSFGLNHAVQRFTGEALFDEKIGGTIHLALGEGYPESGGTNVSALHWDMVCDLRRGGKAYADGELVYEDGRFLGGRF